MRPGRPETRHAASLRRDHFSTKKRFKDCRDPSLRSGYRKTQLQPFQRDPEALKIAERDGIQDGIRRKRETDYSARAR
jgi:hypothetical protein